MKKDHHETLKSIYKFKYLVGKASYQVRDDVSSYNVKIDIAEIITFIFFCCQFLWTEKEMAKVYYLIFFEKALNIYLPKEWLN